MDGPASGTIFLFGRSDRWVSVWGERLRCRRTTGPWLTRGRASCALGRSSRKAGHQRRDLCDRLAGNCGRGSQPNDADLGVASGPRSGSRAGELHSDDPGTRLSLRCPGEPCGAERGDRRRAPANGHHGSTSAREWRSREIKHCAKFTSGARGHSENRLVAAVDRHGRGGRGAVPRRGCDRGVVLALGFVPASSITASVVDRRAPVYQPKRRPRAAIFCGRCSRKRSRRICRGSRTCS
jgi:hypothetical protein